MQFFLDFATVHFRLFVTNIIQSKTKGLFRLKNFWPKEEKHYGIGAWELNGAKKFWGTNFGLQLCTHSHVSPPMTTANAYSPSCVRKKFVKLNT